jgi:WD40 repeat protein
VRHPSALSDIALPKLTSHACAGPGFPSQPLVKIGTLTGHTQGVLDVAINADYIISWLVPVGPYLHCARVSDSTIGSRRSSKDTNILVHARAAPHGLLHRLDLHTGPVNALSIDKHTLASASGDGRVRLWDLRTGEFLRRLKGHDRGLACVSLKEGWVVSGSNDQTCGLLPVAHERDVLALTPPVLDLSIKVWNAETGECVRTLKGHTDLVRSLDFSPSAGIIVSGGCVPPCCLLLVAGGPLD